MILFDYVTKEKRFQIDVKVRNIKKITSSMNKDNEKKHNCQETQIICMCIALKQACQTGGPQAECGPIACPMRPTAILLDLKITLIK